MTFLYIKEKNRTNTQLNVLCNFSHRPIDLDNIYNQDQVKLLMKEGEHLTVPDFDEIYADSEVLIITSIFVQNVFNVLFLASTKYMSSIFSLSLSVPYTVTSFQFQGCH